MDIADGALVDRWCGDGSLPHLRELREAGVWGTPRTTADTMHVSAWPTLHTGTLPGSHGVYHAYRVRSGEQGILRSDARVCAVPPFWRSLDDQGKRCIVIDAFFTYPLDPFRGIQVNEYGTWTWFADPGATPPGVWGEIRRRFGPYPFPEHTKVLTVPRPKWLRDRLVSAVSLKSKMISAFLREKPWDFFYVSFAETHAAGHYLWQVVDSSYPSHEPASAAGLEGALRDVYAAVDGAIGALLREVKEDDYVLVVSADGMGPNYAATNFLPILLGRLGLRHATGEGGGGDRPEGTSGGKRGILGEARRLIPLSLRQEVTKRLPRSVHYRMSMRWASYGID
jgi:predicted AlkP superfamily phosphohydrolase/phosphomutase